MEAVFVDVMVELMVDVMVDVMSMDTGASDGL